MKMLREVIPPGGGAQFADARPTTRLAEKYGTWMV